MSQITTIHQKGVVDNDNHINSTIITTQKHQVCVHERIKLKYVDYEYSGLTQGICGTVTGISVIKEVFRSINRPGSIIWVKWDNGIDLGLIEGVDKYEILSADITSTKITEKVDAD